MKYAVIIPARLNSKRLNRKPLLKIKGIPLIVRTYNQCKKVIQEKNIYVATDSKEIEKICKKNKIKTILTPKTCLTGTDRVYYASKKVKAGHYVNLQGDEPLFNPRDIIKIINESKKYPQEIITGYCKIKCEEEYRSFNIPKVVFSKDKYLMYASRAAIPSNKKNKFIYGYRQVCIYVFPKKKLSLFFSNHKTKIEKTEDIEYLRLVEKGIKIKCTELSNKSISVDTIKDLKLVKKIVK